jgi:putative ABC transport system permease protein
MNLRAREFAMLKSVGMTGREFNRMVRLESIMYGSKSLAIGLPLGVILSYVIYKTISKEIELGYNIPVAALLISVIFVMIIVWMTMHFSLSMIKRQNIIETIRKQTY